MFIFINSIVLHSQTPPLDQQNQGHRSQIADYHEKMQQMWSEESPHDVLSIVVRCYDIDSSKIRFSKKVMQALKDLANDEGMLTLIPMP